MCREAASLQRVIDKERAEAEKVLRRLNRREYSTPEAAQAIDILLLATSEHQQRLILNLTDVHQRILELLGRYVQQCYSQTL